MERIRPSATIAVTDRARALRAEGVDVIGLGAGEPDFDTPDHIKEAAIKAIRDGATKYTAVGGTVELKDAITEKFRRDNGLVYGRDQILVSCGAKQSLYNLCQAVLNPGDEVLIPAPYWVSYPDMALLADAHPVFVDAGADQGYRITPRQLDDALGDRTRLLILNSPCNPTGAAFTAAELEAFGQVLDAYPRVLIATDDMYEHIYWGDEPFTSFASACPQLYDRTVTVNGVSKSYAMTGWRIGYAGAAAPLIKAMTKIQSQSTSNPASMSQAAALAALTGDQTCVTDMMREFRVRHEFVVAALDSLPGVSCRPGAGTFYAFADFSACIEAHPGINDDVELAEYLLAAAGVALVPGTAFGAPGHLRVSFAAGMPTLEEAMRRLADCLGT
ncbi:MAG TPA: pyridoxal phosphate-dependent aminotransferase [Vicinamibacterales bacterium]|nr:pyridoxal phosphate-dependent aminotransferase [Vicinamibacterales bacterium]